MRIEAGRWQRGIIIMRPKSEPFRKKVWLVFNLRFRYRIFELIVFKRKHPSLRTIKIRYY